MDRFAFIDESGNEGMDLTRPQVSSHYVVTALIIQEQELSDAIKVFEQVRSRYFKAGEMKSEKVTNDAKRKMIVHELSAAPFALYVLVGDKTKIKSIGLTYPKSFIKYLQGRLYREVLKDYPQVHIRADEIKGRSFMQQFRRYLEDHNEITLFSQWSWEPVTSVDDVGIQAVDFLGGTIRHAFEANSLMPMHDPRLASLLPHLVQWFPFPEKYQPYLVQSGDCVDDRFDFDIESRAISDAEEFLRRHEESRDEERKLQVALLRLLLARGSINDDWVSTVAIAECLNSVAREAVNEQRLRGIVGTVRDEGLLIASRSTGGYKLPTSLQDLIEFLNRQNTQIEPMLARVKRARDTVRRATNGALDILNRAEYAGLRIAIGDSPHIADGKQSTAE